MNASYLIPSGDLAAAAPELLLCGLGVLILLFDAFWPSLRRAWTPISVAGVVTAAALAWGSAHGESFGGLLETSAFTIAATVIVLLGTALSLLASQAYLEREGILTGEYHALFLWCAAGLVLLVRAQELLTIFLALELLSVCLYALAAFNRRLSVATESALKYFLMGAFVSAFILYGLALLYGQTGSTRLDEVSHALVMGDAGAIGILGMLLLVAGFGFKMSLVPFHAWAPDTYQGAPSPFVAFLSVAPKAAAAMVMIRLLEVAMAGGLGDRWPDLVAFLAVASMLVGNLLALVQRDIKRMLAYSGIAHMGYLMIPLVSLDDTSWTPVLVYLLAYTLMNAGAFVLVSMLYARAGEQHLVSELSGWGYRFPVLGACLAVCMLALGGIPPTFGFIGKYLVFLHAIRHGHLYLAIVGVLASLVGVFYYLRVVYVLYMKEELRAPDGLAIDAWARAAALVAAAATVILGVWPTRILEWLERVSGTL